MKIGELIAIPAATCPTCGAVMHSAEVKETETDRCPVPGDPGVCGECGEILVLDERLQLRIAELNDMLDIPVHTQNQMLDDQQRIRRER